MPVLTLCSSPSTSILTSGMDTESGMNASKMSSKAMTLTFSVFILPAWSAYLS